MARTRQKQKQNITKSHAVPHVEKLRALSRAGFRPDPTNTRQVSRQYRELQSTKHLIRKTDKRTREEARAHGYHVNHKGIVVDGPRDSRRRPIKGSKVKVMRGGVVQTSVGARRDFIYGFTRKEKREFAKDPGATEKRILERLKARFPTLKKARKKQVRLQWGAYQATKDFAPSYFTAKYFAAISPEEVRKVGKKKARPRADKLTGLHIVVHVPSKARKRSVKRGKKGRRK